MAFRLQVMSDLHLEMRSAGQPKDYHAICPVVAAPHLALCGDIGDPATEEYRKFLLAATANHKRVFVVLGNHCTYGRTIEETEAMVHDIARSAPDANLHLMNRTTVRLGAEAGGVVVVGTTLWSHVTDEQRSDVACFIADYRRIRGWSVEANNWRHAGDVRWLEQELDTVAANGERAVVLTHHAPACGYTSAPKNRGGPLTSAFETDLTHLLRPPVAVWACGHTHHSFDVTLPSGTRVVANQVGYPGEGVASRADFSVTV